MEIQSQKKIYYGWFIAIAGFCAMALVYSTIMGSAGIYLKPVCAELGFERASFSAVTTVRAATMIILSSFWGKFMAKGNIKLHMTVCMLLGAVAMWGYSLSSHIWQFYLLSIPMGMAFTGGTTMPFSILINNWFGPKKKGIAMSITFIGSGVGSMIFTPLFTHIILNYGWRNSYRLNGFLILIIMVPIILFVVKKTPAEKGLARMGDLPADEKAAKAGKLPVERRGMDFAEAKTAPMTYFVMGAFAISVVASSSLATQAVSYFTDIGFQPMGAAQIISILSMGLIVSKIILGWASDKFGSRMVTPISFLLLGISSLFLYSAAFSHSMVIPYVPFYCLGVSAITVCQPLCVADLFGEKAFGTLIGISTMATGVGAAIGPWASAMVYDKTGSYGSAWIICAVILVVAAILLAVSFRMRKQYQY